MLSEIRCRFFGTHPSTTDHALRCSFCGRPQSEVQKLIAGPTVYICEACAEISLAAVEEARGGRQRTSVEILIADVGRALEALTQEGTSETRRSVEARVRNAPRGAVRVRCTFCNRSMKEAVWMVAAGDHDRICAECISLVSELIAEENGAARTPPVSRAPIHLEVLHAIAGGLGRREGANAAALALAREVARYFRFPLEDERLLSYRCSFCGWTGADVSHIIEAGNGVEGEGQRIVAICDRCVDVRRAELANEPRLPIEELRARARAALATSPQEWIVELEDRLRRVPPSLDLGPGHCSFCDDESARLFAGEADGGICADCVTATARRLARLPP